MNTSPDRDQASTGEAQMSAGIALTAVRLVVVGARWTVRPTVEK